MNKAAKTSTVITVGVIALVLLLGLIGAKTFGLLPQTAIGGTAVDVGSSGQYLATGSTALTYAGVDKFAAGTSVSSATRTSVNGAAFQTGITSASPGNKLNVLLLNGTSYHNQYVKDHVVPAAATDVIPVEFNGNATVTVTMFNTNNLVLTNGGGATNQTAAAGGSYTMAIRFDSSNDDSTQDMRCLLESSDGASTEKVTFSLPGAVYVGMAKPNSYTLSGTGSEVYVYDVPAISDAASVSGTVQISSTTSGDLSGDNLEVHCLTKEYFLDSTTGQVMYDIENTAGTAQSIADYSYTVYFD